MSIPVASMEFFWGSTYSLAEQAQQSYWTFLLKEDIRVIRSGGGHKITLAKQDLEELENRINKASFFLSGSGPSGTIDGLSRRSLRSWISEAQKAAFCLEDQIAMYAIHGSGSVSHLEQLSAMKSAIGMFSTDELMKAIQDRINDMPNKVRNSSNEVMARLPEILPVTRYCHRKADLKLFGRGAKIDELKKILLEGADPVIFVIGKQLSGKTALVNKVYEDSSVKNYFKVRSKVDMAKTRCLADLLRAVLKHEEREANSIDPDAIDEFTIIEEIHRALQIQGSRYLIVLDDVQDTPSPLNVLRQVLRGCEGKIVCLTRSKDIKYEEKHAKVEVLPLEPADQRKLLAHVVNFQNAGGTSFAVPVDDKNKQGQSEDILVAALQGKTGTKPADETVATLNGILEKCRGNPWNIQTAGALLDATSIDGWAEIVEKVDAVVIGDGKRRDPLVQLEDALLPREIRLGFLYCLAFPDRSEIPQTSGIPVQKLLRLWMAEGFLPHNSPRQSEEQAAEHLLQKLIDKNLLVVEKTGFDGEVLRCRINKDLRRLAVEICELHKFCRIAPGSPQPGTSTTTTTTRAMAILSRRKKKALSLRYRVLAVHVDEGVHEASSAMAKDIRLRSLLYFRTRRARTEHSRLDPSFGRTYKLLLTLELQGANLIRLPASIACLVCLRYLGLRGTQLEYLPATLQRLRRLMCLDIRDTGIAEVDDVSAFREMRHLYLANSFRDQSVLIKEGLPSLLHLRTLSGAAHEVSAKRTRAGMIPFEQELLYLKLLRKLSVKRVSRESSEQICEAINNMEFLQSLTITCSDDNGPFDLAFLEIKNNLRKLKLGGAMDNFDRLQPRMQSITYLYLWDSNLQEDPLERLQGLRDLLLLSLYNAYNRRKKMTCANGFHKLKKLSIIAMENLEECTFGLGAAAAGTMNKLEELVFAKCSKLISPPPGLDQLVKLQHVHLFQMDERFIDGLDPKTRNLVRVPEFQNHIHVHSSRAAAAQN